MLKRKGEPCQRTVPDYSGRLTDFEFLAYNTVFTLIENDVKELSEAAEALKILEHSWPGVADVGTSEKILPEAIVSNGAQWEVAGSLLKLRKSEWLFCKRHIRGAKEFAIVERLDQDSPLAESRGICETHTTSNDARLLIQDFIEGQRHALDLWAHDLAAVVREKMEEQYPGRDLKRVVKAIHQRCSKTISEASVVPIRVQKQAVRV
jgi:hypothetical protein